MCGLFELISVCEVQMMIIGRGYIYLRITMSIISSRSAKSREGFTPYQSD
jgi:hypothetical protein